MTTYDGRAASFVPGREVPNREPAVSKFVVEKLYKVHRERVINIEPVVDCHSFIPSFIGDTTWKQIALEHKQKEIAFANEIMYGRIEKQAKEESQIKKDSREHIKRVLDIKKHTKRLKENGRLHKEMLIRKENELLHARIERARPQYTLKSMKDWYKYHQNFKDGRRSDPTAGHIMKVSSRLLPDSLPKVSDSLDGGFKRAQTPLFQSSVLSKGKKIGNKQRPSTSPSKVQHSASLSLLNMMNSGSEVMAFPEMPGFPLSGKAARMSMTVGSNTTIVNHKRLSVLAGYQANVLEEKVTEATTGEELLAHMVEVEALYGLEEEQKDDVDDDESVTECLHSRPFSIPYDHRNCCVQVRVSKDPNLIGEETLEFRVYNLENPPLVLSKRSIPESRAKTIVDAKSNAMHKVAAEENMTKLRSMLIEMFEEVDDDANGYLTFDEFEILMDKMDLGVSKQELRYVISEADDNGNGVVDFDEFVPLAVDLIQSFSAKIKAKLEVGEIELEEDIEMAVKKLASQEELDMLGQVCLEKIKGLDSHGYGVLRIADLKRCLISVSHMGLKEIEINLVPSFLPKDSHGRVIYNNFAAAYSNARFAAEKMTRIDNSTSPVCNKLIELCKKQEIEENNIAGAEEDSAIGNINVRSFTRILQSPEFNLSRLQVLVLMSESYTTDGLLNYYQYVPMLSRTIEKMFDPKVLRQRAELITKTDLSVDALLEKMPPNALDERLFALFKSHDVDHNGVLNEEEFKRCLDSLDLGLSKDEILLFLISADSTHSCLISFEDFKKFFKENLRSLNSDKHLRTVQTLIHSNNNSKKADPVKSSKSMKLLRGRETSSDEKEITVKDIAENMKTSLLTIFQTHDVVNSGSVSFTEVDKVVRQLNTHITEYQLSVILSEVPIDDSGNLQYNEFIPKLVSLLMAFRANEEVEEARHEKEVRASNKARQAIERSPHVMNSIIQFLKQRFSVIDRITDDVHEKQLAVIAAVKNSHSGLSAKEANILSAKFCKMIIGRPVRRASVSVTQKSFSKHSDSPHHNNHKEPRHHNNQSGKGAKRDMKGELESPSTSVRIAYDSIIQDITSDSQDSFEGNVAKSGKLYCGISSADIKVSVHEVRKQSLVRSYLEMDADTIDFKIFDALHQESLTLIEDGIIEKGNKFIPASTAMNILRYHPDLHLDRSEIFSIMTLADHCYDETHTQVHYVKFAAFAANIIIGLHIEDGDHHIDDEKIHNEDVVLLNGLTDEQMEAYLKDAFAVNDSSDSSDKAHKHEVDVEVFRKIIKETPKVNYSDKEVAFIVNTFPVNENGMVHWEEYMHWAHGMAHSIARDRLVNRKELLQKQAANSPAKIVLHKDDNIIDSDIKSIENLSPIIQTLYSSSEEKEKEKRLDELAVLAQKAMNFVKIKMHNGEPAVSFPDDPSNRKASVIVGGGGSIDESVEETTEVIRLLKAAKMVPCISDLDKASSIHPKTRRIACVLSIMAISGTVLRIKLISIDDRYVIDQDLPISLPSLGLVDNDLAREFANNCADLLYIETSFNGEVLKMREQ